MISEYFSQTSKQLEELHRQALADKVLPNKEKDLSIYQGLFSFLNDHLPGHFSLATGKVRNKRHLLNRNCDALIYHKWCKKFLEMSGGYVLADHLYAFLSIESDLMAQNLITHVNLTQAMKSLYKGEENEKEFEVIPLYSLLFTYSSKLSLPEIRKLMQDYDDEKEIPMNKEIDLIGVLGTGLIIKDWEAGGYKIVETGEDTLLWFFILLLEYIDRDGRVGLDLRSYIKNVKEYNEY